MTPRPSIDRPPPGADLRARPDLSGQVLDGRHELLERIGQGGMGDVYRAHFLPGQTDEAVKILDQELARDAEQRRRFIAEFRVLHQLAHPGLVRAWDQHTSEDGLLVYFSMELLAGEGLDAILWREGPLAPARAIRLLLPVCDALSFLHARGVIHRDLKPSNLLVLHGEEPARVKLIDLGIARRTAAYHATDRRRALRADHRRPALF